jgi:AAA15 family ATPase/GTPase
MNVLFTGNYKSLNNFDWIDIPQLAILTGLNGSGKSQLLELIQWASQELSDRVRYKNPSQDSIKNIHRQEAYTVTIQGAEFNHSGILSWKSYGGNFSFEHYSFSYRDLREIINIITIALNPPSSRPQNIEEEDTSTEYQRRGIARTKHIINDQKQKIVDELIKRTNKSQQEILPEDILFHLPEEIIFENRDIISQDFLDMIFFLYIYRKISLETNNKDTSSLGLAPWEILNQVISTAGLPYHFTAPNDEPIRAIFRNPLNQDSAYKYSVLLVDNNEKFIGIQGLSSGEKIILSLAMLLYYFQHRQVRKDIIILDEVDAFLHPSLTKQFFDVVNQNIIKQYGARVIMATHSPSTVALAPEDSLFIIEKHLNRTTVKKTNKDSALNLLTSGVPSLSINYENRRQIFVESKYDVEYYDTVYKTIKNKLTAGVSLNFISAGINGNGNCDQVLTIVKQLRDFGNKSIFGIIDWDKQNESTRNIRVLGEGKRYSMDSFVFDPLLMGYFLYREKVIGNAELDLQKDFRILDFRDLTKNDGQKIANWVLEKIKPKFKDTKDGALSEAVYSNGIKISLPNWFLFNYGHELWKFYMETFPPLMAYRNENELRKAVLENTIVDLPEFIPNDLLQLMEYFHLVKIHEEEQSGPVESHS